MNNNKIKNTITIDKVICAVDKFILDLDTIIQVSCGPGSQGIMFIDTFEGQLSGPASIINIITGGIPGCADGCPAGSTDSEISPDGKEGIILFNDCFAVVFPSQSFAEKCCSIGLEFSPFEPNKKQIIKFDIRFTGSAELESGCSANLLVNSNNIITLTGPLVDSYEANITINAILACPQNPQITISNQNISAMVYESGSN